MMPFGRNFGLSICLGALASATLAQQYAASVATSVTVKQNGQTQLMAKLSGIPVVVLLTTHSIPKPPDTKDFPFDYNSNCTASREPCVLTDNLRIKVNGTDLDIPRSAYADCSDLASASLSRSGETYSLLLLGGDASAAYRATIVFTGKRLLERNLVSAENRPYVTERTRYYVTPGFN